MRKSLSENGYDPRSHDDALTRSFFEGYPFPPLLYIRVLEPPVGRTARSAAATSRRQARSLGARVTACQ